MAGGGGGVTGLVKQRHKRYSLTQPNDDIRLQTNTPPPPTVEWQEPSMLYSGGGGFAQLPAPDVIFFWQTFEPG